MRRGTIIDGRFKVEAQIGEGGMGTVYRAWDQLKDEPVAFKVLIDRDVANEGRFDREARVLAELRHPGIVRYIAHGSLPEGSTYLVMEWVDGESLADRIEHRGLTIAESVLVARKVAEALGDAHAKGIVHRDVKTSNLMLVDGDLSKVKVIDFGIARRLREVTKLTSTGVMVGSPGYAAPEQARASKDVDARADVFALGCVLYECMTGAAAFSGEHLLAKLAKVLLGDPAPVRVLCPEVPLPLEALVDRMLAKDPSFRPHDGGEVARALGEVGDLPPSPRRPRRRQEEPTREIHHGTIEQPGVVRAGEQFVCLVLAASADDELVETMDTVTVDQHHASEDELRAAAAPFGGAVEVLADGSVVVVFEGRENPVEQTSRAARCAVKLRELLPRLSLMLAADSARGETRQVVVDLIDRGVRALRADALQAIFSEYRAEETPEGAIRLDGLAARMLQSAPFELRQGKSGHFLLGERGGSAS